MREIQANPATLVEGGRFRLGTFQTPFGRWNALDARLGQWVALPRWWKNLRLKEWEHFVLANENHFVSLALFNAKTLALAQVCWFERGAARTRFYERKTLASRVVLPDQLADSRAEYTHKGFRLTIENRLVEGLFRIGFEIAGSKGQSELTGDFQCRLDPSLHPPIVVCLPLPGDRALASYKNVCPLEGTLESEGRRIDFPRDKSFALADIHKGYYPTAMKWHWACGGGFGGSGGLIGFNLTDNQVEDQAHFNENCFWKDGQLFFLPAVRFEFDRKAPQKPWRIRDPHGQVELEFRPEGIRTVDVNLLVLKTHYRGPVGVFRGLLCSVEGKQLKLDNALGMCEDFYLRA